MSRLRLSTLALASLYGAVPFPVWAGVTLVAPTQLDRRVDGVRDSLAANHDGEVLRVKTEGMFEQAQRTHHMPVGGGIGQWQRPERFNRTQREATLDEMVQTHRRILSKEPPSPIPNVELQNRVAQDYGRLVQDFLSFEQLAAASGVKKDERGELGAGVAAAWVWNVAKAAKDGTVEGMMVVQPALLEASRILGEFVLATLGAHEPRHSLQHKEAPKALADEVKVSERAAFLDEGALLHWMDPTGEKMMYLWTVTVERPGTPRFVVDYVKHLNEVRFAYTQGEEGIKKLVDSRGYQDQKGLWAYHRQHAHGACEPGHKHD